MKSITLAAMCPGVEPSGDSLVFHVQSDHDPEIKYIVDKTAWFGFGACTCPDFQMRRQPFIKAGQIPCPRLECKHLKRVNRYQAIELSQTILRQRQRASDANCEASGHKPRPYEAEAPAC